MPQSHSSREPHAPVPDGPASGIQYLELFVEQAPVAVAMFDLRMRYLAASERWRRDYGIDGRELRGLCHYDVFPEISDQWKEVHARGMAGETVRAEQDRFDRADGSVQWLRWEVRPWRTPEGEVGGLVIVTEEITSRIRAEMEVRHAAELLDFGDAFLELDTQYRIVRVNAHQERLSRKPRQETLGRVIWDVWPDVVGDSQYWRGCHRCMRDRVPVFFEEYYAPLDLWTDVRAYPVSDGGIAVFFNDATARKRSELTIRRFVAASPALMYAMERHQGWPRVVWHGGNLEGLTGWSEADVDDQWWSANIHPDDRERWRAAPDGSGRRVDEFRFRRPNGSYMWLRDERHTIATDRAHGAEVVGSWSDVTKRVELELQLRQAQKLEAVGTLAGGIAHDFNNLLTVISGNGELLADSFVAGTQAAGLLSEIREAARRAAALTSQLLAFSRAQALAPQTVDVGDALRCMDASLRRAAGDDISLSCSVSAEACCVSIDPGQLEQVLVNLIANARDAMPRGGTIGIEVTPVLLDQAFCDTRPGLAPGDWMRLRVSDTGTGMNEEVLSRAFEPFFSTKEAWQGAGLGLSAVFGIVTQSRGHVEFESQMGVGTVCSIYLPRIRSIAARQAEAPADAKKPQETVLVVEDEEPVRRLTVSTLERHGYRVLSAASGREALPLFDGDETIDLLITDLVMPGVSGRELAARAKATRPNLKIVLMSGYAEQADASEPSPAGERFVAKPFGLAAFLRTVRDVLDS